MTLPDGLFFEISLDYENWAKALPDHEAFLEKALKEIINNIKEGAALSKFSHIEISVVLCDDALIHELNNNYREKNKATNVLSFPGLEREEIEDFLLGDEVPENRPYSLGEIYIAFETVELEAQKSAILFKDHYQHLIIHGILHLLGYDHIIDAEAEVMEKLETKLLGNLGIDDPYSA